MGSKGTIERFSRTIKSIGSLRHLSPCRKQGTKGCHFRKFMSMSMRIA